MKNIFLMLLFSISIFAQKTVSVNLNTEIVTAEASYIIPFGNLANKFDYAHSYGFWFKLKKENSLNINAGFSLIFLQNPKSINYRFNDLNYTLYSNKFGFDIGIKALKTIPISIKNNYFEFGGTIGFHYLDYDFPSDMDEQGKKKSNDTFRNVTFLISPEIKYMINNVGLKFQYRYTPYEAIEGIESNFGSHSIALGIVYKQ